MTCTVCRSPRAGEINRALLAGDPVRDVAAHHGLSKSAISRHEANCMPAKLASAKGASEIASTARLLERLDLIGLQTVEILEVCKVAKDHRISLRAIARLEKQLELQAKIVGLIQAAPLIVNVVAEPEWLQLRTVIFIALSNYPEAQAAVIEAISPYDEISPE